MPISKENRKLYPPYWRQLSAYIRYERASNRCEHCHAKNHEPHPITGAKVILTTAHLDHNPAHSHPRNLAALCQRCHNRYDAQHRAATRRNKKVKTPQGIKHTI